MTGSPSSASAPPAPPPLPQRSGGRIDLRARLAERPAVLAPMSGVTDAACRVIAHRLGAGLVVSEMIASDALAEGRGDMTRRAEGAGVIAPLVIQLAGREPVWMGLGAKVAQDAGADVIDINMGCPAKQVTRGASGSALMRDLDHALTLIDAVVAAAEVPVTLKMRLGWDHDTINAPELARRAEAAGVAVLTVHGRTRCPVYDGVADARTALERSGAAAVMVGRAAVGAPWLPGQIADALAGRPITAFDADAKAAIALEHFDRTLDLYGDARGVRIFRKHLAAYASAAPQPRGESQASNLCRLSHAGAIRDALSALFNGRIFEVGRAA